MVLDLNSVYYTAWNTFKKNWWEYVVVSLIMLILMLLPLGGILQFFVTLLMINAILKALKGNAISFSAFFKFKEIFNTKVIIFVVALGLYSFLIQMLADNLLLSFLMTIIVFVLSIIFFPIFCVLIDKDFDIKKTILYSADLTKNIRFEILLVVAINFIIGMIGIMLLFIGIFVAIPIVAIAGVQIYIMLDNKFNNTPTQSQQQQIQG